MFYIANWPSNCANHTAGFSAQKGGTRIPTQLIVKVESGGCSSRVDGSAFCCMMRSREEYRTNSRHCAVFYSRGHRCGGIGMNYQTHTQSTRTRTMYVRATLCLRVRAMPAAGRLLVAAPNRVTHWHHLAVPTYTRNWCLTVYKVVVYER
jgi:hypothetical protein